MPPSPYSLTPVARVLLADDHDLMRRLLRTAFGVRAEVEVVGEAGDGHEAIALTRALEPDLVILDLAMPGADGLEVARAIRAAQPRCAILVVSAYEADALEAEALAAGAD